MYNVYIHSHHMQHFPHTVSAKRKRKNAFKRPSFGAFLVAGTLLDLTFFPAGLQSALFHR